MGVTGCWGKPDGLLQGPNIIARECVINETFVFIIKYTLDVLMALKSLAKSPRLKTIFMSQRFYNARVQLFISVYFYFGKQSKKVW